jgi:protein-disulfide isomerase
MNAFEEGEQDLTRKQRREQARIKRKELEEAEAARAVRRTRLVQLGVVGEIVVAIIVGILIATGSSGKKGIAPAPQAKSLVAKVEGLLGGIPQSGNSLGNPHAPVTLQYFADLECPVCREFTLGALGPLIEHDVRTGKLRIEYRSLETATREPETFRTQQVAALAAGNQQKLWQFAELFYHQQGEENSGYVTESYLQNLARQVPGLNQAKWQSDRANGQLTNALVADSQAAASAGLSGTPSFMIGRTGGRLQKLEYASLTDPASFESAVDSVAKK